MVEGAEGERPQGLRAEKGQGLWPLCGRCLVAVATSGLHEEREENQGRKSK